MSPSREKDSADFDLDRFIRMFDEALTSQDPRVIDALRGLLMIVTLTRTEAKSGIDNQHRGPLRRLVDDVTNLNRRLGAVENRVLRESAQNIPTVKYDGLSGPIRYDNKAFGQVESRLYPNEVWDQEQKMRNLNQSIKGLMNE